MQLRRLIPSCLTNKREDQSTNDDTEDDANVHKGPIISRRARLSRTSVRFILLLFESSARQSLAPPAGAAFSYLSFRTESRNLSLLKINDSLGSRCHGINERSFPTNFKGFHRWRADPANSWNSRNKIRRSLGPGRNFELQTASERTSIFHA